MNKIAIQGVKGSFHYETAEKLFNHEDVSYLECNSFIEVVKSVRGSDADYGVIAIENFLIGTILPNYKLISTHNLYVVGEYYLPINLNLMALPGQSIESIKEVWSHPLAIAQSENFLEEYSNQWNVIKKMDTARCARQVEHENLRGIGVLASKTAAHIYRLNILKENVQNENDSYTRFFLLSKKKSRKKIFNKASISFTLKHKSGALVSLLQKISDLDINLSKILSVPTTAANTQFMFYIDVVFDDTEKYKQLLLLLKEKSDQTYIFGEYKQHEQDVA